MRPIFLILAVLLSFSTVSSRAELLGYWALNESLSPSLPSSATLTTTIDGSILDRQGYGPEGSTLNLEPGFQALQSRRFFDLASLDAFEGTIQITGIDLVGLSLPTLSFAMKKSHWAELFTYFYVEVDTGSGWTFYADLEDELTHEYSLQTVTIETPLPLDLTNFGIRVVFGANFDVVDFIDIDNVQVNAVPEPSTFLLCAGAALLLGLVARRRRRAC